MKSIRNHILTRNIITNAARKFGIIIVGATAVSSGAATCLSCMTFSLSVFGCCRSNEFAAKR